METALSNLYSLYNLVGRLNIEATIIKNDCFQSIVTKNSAWPNAIFDVKNNQIKEDSFFKLVAEKNLPKLLLIENDASQYLQIFKKNFIVFADRWILMELYVKDYNLKNTITNNYSFERISNTEDLKEWEEIVSDALFSSKPINLKIITDLLQNNCFCFALKRETKIVGTTFVFIDKDNTAGIYMVCVPKEERSKGIGKILMHNTIMQIANLNLNKLVLQATKIGESLYENLGFKKKGNIDLLFKLK